MHKIMEQLESYFLALLIFKPRAGKLIKITDPQTEESWKCYLGGPLDKAGQLVIYAPPDGVFPKDRFTIHPTKDGLALMGRIVHVEKNWRSEPVSWRLKLTDYEKNTKTVYVSHTEWSDGDVRYEKAQKS